MVMIQGVEYKKPKSLTSDEWGSWVKKKNGFYRSERYKNKAKRLGLNTWKHRRERILRYYAKNPEPFRARNAVSRALRKGTLVRKPCKVCGEKKVQAHHYKGYDKKYWLIVQWLCI